MQYGKNDLIREFEFEHARCQHYFELMYKVIQFTFAAIIAVVVVVFQGNSNEQYGALLLMLVLPVCIYVFGALYAFNAYALAVGGDRAEAIHEKIYENERETFLKEHDNMEDSLESFDKIFQSYVISCCIRCGFRVFYCCTSFFNYIRTYAVFTICKMGVFHFLFWSGCVFDNNVVYYHRNCKESL